MISLLFNMLSRLVIGFLPRSKRLLISWLQSPSAVILEPKKIKVCHFPLFPHLFALKTVLLGLRNFLCTQSWALFLSWHECLSRVRLPRGGFCGRCCTAPRPESGQGKEQLFGSMVRGWICGGVFICACLRPFTVWMEPGMGREVKRQGMVLLP